MYLYTHPYFLMRTVKEIKRNLHNYQAIHECELYLYYVSKESAVINVDI